MLNHYNLYTQAVYARAFKSHDSCPAQEIMTVYYVPELISELPDYFDSRTVHISRRYCQIAISKETNAGRGVTGESYGYVGIVYQGS